MDNQGDPAMRDAEYALTRAELMAARAERSATQPSKVFVSAQMDAKLARRLADYASKQKITRSEAMRRAIVKLLP